ncbi:hypothetical protein AB0I49_12785 [Streptomyces sp. NPDC050617]|uniref:hypothetical protein n=1 Tax=Streptomyces sp. NPDC050617 TaxID=3154628 RepID=UPI003441992D
MGETDVSDGAPDGGRGGEHRVWLQSASPGASHGGSGGGSDGEKLKAELNKLKAFQSRVNDILKGLSASDASPTNIGRDKVTGSHLGASAFDEAQDLYTAYHQVHSQLETLSQLLSDQIEAMGTAVQSARVSYANVDLEQQARMWAAQTEFERHYHPEGENAPSDTKAPGSDQVQG